ncbi:dipeptide/oligopeptide/nickel ABC transporter ATP-binding protein [Priestia flexa]|uniref:ABC transporter ATP-binding protein n=1 Tax=Priestia TaxID=2800373 RepID=UPI00077C8B22|nr:dipeptide/oligopeptide/nickel ABC transporter ATP-binding protein [Priestia flexa]AQX54661.1 dipeptide/oligopeptide/nickel ABC transporter ATP-binding protein [Priestia flexa]MCA1201885.1 dipeptide/oligopeptide/nickel ABC transporter ATP-binding protein [Priestia flexa]MCG7313812.1 dipeptide/oligopeptide/nickel ABC transporter ATP-binding protein [Priestia flexa]MCM3068149.1 dipeptide/oligopeptide/nickel ABC transporter ATP-binding protein [Priestia flexa]MEC0666398.1 dipeptide/oligopeptide
MSLLSVQNLTKTYGGQQVLKNVSFDLKKGECLGLVGESGCGKSTLSRCLMRLEQVNSGKILFRNQEIQSLSSRKLMPIRKGFQIVFQNPTAALNPKLKIKDSLLDPYLQYRKQLSLRYFSFSSKEQFVSELLNMVGLPASIAERYPHELSGGQKQRVTLARAISIEPELVILDEPTASLDVISQRSILHLLEDLRDQLDLSYLFISHDLTAVKELSQRIMVMKQGEVVDMFRTEELFHAQRNPYTKELVSIF